MVYEEDLLSARGGTRLEETSSRDNKVMRIPGALKDKRMSVEIMVSEKHVAPTR